jgi:5'-nucleotidase
MKLKNQLPLQILMTLVLVIFSGCCTRKIILPGNLTDPIQEKLTIIHFNDGESHLLNAGSEKEDYGGIARFATIIKNIRSEAKSTKTPSLTISAGDNFVAGPVFNVSLQKGPPYYDALALDSIEVDALALGNHDFDFGPDILADFIKSFNYTKPLFLSANIDVTQEPKLLELQKAGKIAKTAIIEKDGKKFGLIGLTTPDLKTISSPRNVIVNHNLVSVVQNAINSLNKAGVNKIILISHLQGIEHETALVKQLHGLDVVIAGGGGELLTGKTCPFIADNIPEGVSISGPYPIYVTDKEKRNIPLVTTPGNYCYVGRLDLTFDSNGEITEVLPSSRPIMVIGENLKGSVAPDRIIQETVVLPVAKSISISSKVVGTSKVYLDGRKENTRSRETNLGNLAADALFWSASRHAKSFKAAPPTIAMLNGGAIRQSIPAGIISDATLFAACPFYDFITIVEGVSPHKLKLLFESTVAQITGNSANSKNSSGGFPQLSNVSIIYNPTRKPGDRIKQIKLKNGDLIVANYKVVQYAPYINIATLSFLANGGDKWNFGSAPKINIGVPLQNALINYISTSNKAGGLNKIILKKQYPTEGLNRVMLTRE